MAWWRFIGIQGVLTIIGALRESKMQNRAYSFVIGSSLLKNVNLEFIIVVIHSNSYSFCFTNKYYLAKYLKFKRHRQQWECFYLFKYKATHKG